MSSLSLIDEGLDEGSDMIRNPSKEPDESGPSRDLASAPSGVSIFNNLGTPEDQERFLKECARRSVKEQ